jgi:hypothetical protein
LITDLRREISEQVSAYGYGSDRRPPNQRESSFNLANQDFIENSESSSYSNEIYAPQPLNCSCGTSSAVVMADDDPFIHFLVGSIFQASFNITIDKAVNGFEAKTMVERRVNCPGH